MRAYEFIKPILREYKRDITIRNQKTKDQIYQKFRNEDLYDHWFNSDEKMINHILKIIDSPDYTDIDKINKIKQLSNYTRMLTTNPELIDSYGIDKEKLANSVLEQIEEYDPTDNNMYVPWLLREYIKNNIRRLEDMTDYNSKLSLYHQYKNRRGFPQAAKDIMRLDTNLLSQVVAKYNPNDPISIRQNMGKYDIIYGDIDISYDEFGNLVTKQTSEILVVRPLNETSSIYFGKVFGGNSEWCTAYIPPRTNRFDEYNQKGPLYIIIPEYPEHEGEKYQLHGPSNQYMDENDDPINIVELLNNRFPEIKDLIVKLIPEIQYSLYLVSDDILERVWKACFKIINDKLGSIVSDISDRDQSWMEYQADAAIERGYVDDNGDIDWDKVYEDPDLSYEEYNPNVGDVYVEVNHYTDMNIKEIRNTLYQYLEEYDHYDDDSILKLEVIIGEIIYKNNRNSNIYKDLYDSIISDIDITYKKSNSLRWELIDEVGNIKVYGRY